MYKLIRSLDAEELERLVAEQLCNGWFLVGGVAVHPVDGYVQAVCLSGAWFHTPGVRPPTPSRPPAPVRPPHPMSPADRYRRPLIQ